MTLAFPEFKQNRCVRFRYRYSECRRCADACPHEAVALSDDGAAVDETLCQNCALCTSACRTEALIPGNLARIELLKQAVKLPAFTFACAPSQAAADAVVPCLGALDPAMLGFLAKRGVGVTLTGADHCDACPHGAKGRAQIELNLEALSRLKERYGDASWAALEFTQGEDDPAAAGALDSGRRQLFRRFVGRGVDEMLKTGAPSQPVPEKAIRAGRLFVTTQRELLDLVCKGSEPDRPPLAAHPGLPLMDLALEPGCTACEACFRVCPTGALDIRETETAWELSFRHERCVACGVCMEVCQPGVLCEAPSVEGAGVKEIVLHRLRKQRCERCDRFFISAMPAEECPVCADDADAFTAIFG